MCLCERSYNKSKDRTLDLRSTFCFFASTFVSFFISSNYQRGDTNLYIGYTAVSEAFFRIGGVHAGSTLPPPPALYTNVNWMPPPFELFFFERESLGRFRLVAFEISVLH